MINYVDGNMLEFDADILCHQVNCKGVMGGGVAKQIREKLLTAQQFESYRSLCLEKGADLLGSVQYLPVDSRRYVANIFAQDGFGRGQLQTDYTALEKGLRRIEEDCRDSCLRVAVPGYIGCGLAGGDWNHVYRNIIKPIFEHLPVLLSIVYLEHGGEGSFFRQQKEE